MGMTARDFLPLALACLPFMICAHGLVPESDRDQLKGGNQKLQGRRLLERDTLGKYPMEQPLQYQPTTEIRQNLPELLQTIHRFNQDVYDLSLLEDLLPLQPSSDLLEGENNDNQEISLKGNANSQLYWKKNNYCDDYVMRQREAKSLSRRALAELLFCSSFGAPARSALHELSPWQPVEKRRWVSALMYCLSTACQDASDMEKQRQCAERCQTNQQPER